MDAREDRARRTARVVVGVDGSPDPQAALVWALRAAAARGSVLVVVTAFPADVSCDDPGASDVRVEADRWEAVRRTQELLADALAGLEVTVAQPPSIEIAVVPGEPAERLLEHSRGAALLVLGNDGCDRGRLRLGTVARHCVLTAPCRVVVVQPLREMGPDDADAAVLERSRS